MTARQPRPRRAATRRPVTPTAAEETGTRPVPRGAPPCPIAVIVASAGGLGAFKAFFSAMPADPALAFVLVPHLDPTHESLMVELMAKQTAMPVREATDGTAVEPNHVYIIPPNRYLAVSEGALRLSVPTESRGRHTAIDFALQSLARDQGERAIGILLSGTGSHGTQGLKDIKLAGGMVMVQTPESAEYDQMPRNAIATGMVDFVLSPKEMPAVLLRYIAHPYLDSRRRETAPPEPADALRRILALLSARTKGDFRVYREAMLVRRIQRRMSLAQIVTYDDYLTYLRDQPAEANALYKDLLIGVTSFFREPEAFRVLEQRVVPDLVSRPGPDRTVRVWIPGCASGEEAYSIAILFMERFIAGGTLPRLQLFASDIDDDALEVARQGVYLDTATAAVSPERLARFFVPVDQHHYRVNQQLRETIVFAPQNLLSDAPFSKLDLISCRNLLIYLEPAVQRKVIALFHFALNDDGYLLLGPAESIGEAGDLFEPVAKKHRVFRRRTGRARRELVDIPIVTGADRRRRPPRMPPVRPPVRFTELMRQALVADFAPASVLVNQRYEMLCVQGPIDDYLTFPPGEVTKDLMSMARRGLRTKIRAACDRAIRAGEAVTRGDARVARVGKHVRCAVTVRPLTEPAEAVGLLLVTFRDVGPGPADQEAAAGVLQSAEEATAVRELEEELTATREDHQTTIEELESSNEELKAANEEMMSMNEELQSANEELETSKEELQSLNEEISTVNNQLQDKVDQLDRANNDMTNLLASSDVATVFLSPDLRIVRYTPAIAPLLNIVATDVGRPLQDLAPRFEDDSLQNDCRTVVEQLKPIEKEVGAAGGRAYLHRIRPYRTVEDRIDGVVITFFDITERLAAERGRAVAKHDHEEAERLRRMVEHLPAGALYLSGEDILLNEAAETITGYARGELSTRATWFTCLYGRRADEARAEYALGREQGFPAPIRSAITRKDGAERIIDLVGHRFDDHDVWLLHDVTAQLTLEDHMHAVVTAATDAIIAIDRHGIIESFNPAAERLFGFTAIETIGRNVSILMPEPYRS